MLPGEVHTVQCHYAEQSPWHMDIQGAWTQGRNNAQGGGGSIPGMRRILHYALLSGATFFSEEWGMENTFGDWRTFEPTPYGLAIQEFMRFVETAPALGKPPLRGHVHAVRDGCPPHRCPLDAAV